MSDTVKEMHRLFCQKPADEPFSIEVSRSSCFNYPSDSMIILSRQDVFQLLTGEWLNVSVLQVFMMFLSDESDRNGDSNIGFMCPSMISETMLRHEPDAAINYMQRTLRTNRNMKFIMLPYIESQHWILLVLSLHKKRNGLRLEKYVELKQPIPYS
ncbi:uncharacterized protein LOC130591891 [Beta vulgaris subsp. vulgaris]|uniref:uncharacterized protein LOC130591891 n=1 Tax=Beta vulgaris subsp. vulgaris TaxID=3555 RepID=UPI00254687DC|nr:uncharacterized protein LOC130591891 [Beta vulgaris subsp. vulgaris]